MPLYSSRLSLEICGIRIGTPAITSRGFKEEECRKVAELIVDTLTAKEDEEKLAQVKESVRELTRRLPLYK
nr:hypothetical protein [Alkalibacterium olivapovliticus]